MTRTLLTTTVVAAADGGDLVAVQNALVQVYETGTTTPASGMFAAPAGGSAVSSLVTDTHGVVSAWFDVGRTVDLFITDNFHTAFRVGGSSTPVLFDGYTISANAGGGGGGAVASVEGRTGAVTLADLYLSLLNGGPTPTIPTTVGAATFTPDLTAGGRQKVTTTGNPTIMMPTVAAGTTYRSWFLVLKMDGTGGYGDPTWDPKVTWIGIKSTRQQGAGKFDQYLFETDDGGTTWSGWHITASFAVGANWVTWKGISAASVPIPAAGSLNQFVDSADGVMKVKDEHNELHVMLDHVATTAPANTAIPWQDIT